MASVALNPIPSHVPPELAFDSPLFARMTTYENPHETVIPQMHATLPPIAYITNIFPGKRPGWLLKRGQRKFHQEGDGTMVARDRRELARHPH
jgi:hypothetical protein